MNLAVAKKNLDFSINVRHERLATGRVWTYRIIISNRCKQLKIAKIQVDLVNFAKGNLQN